MSHTKKLISQQQKIEEFSGEKKKSQEKKIKLKMMKTDRARRLGKKTREKTGKMTALRFQTGGNQYIFSASS